MLATPVNVAAASVVWVADAVFTGVLSVLVGSASAEVATTDGTGRVAASAAASAMDFEMIL